MPLNALARIVTVRGKASVLSAGAKKQPMRNKNIRRFTGFSFDKKLSAQLDRKIQDAALGGP
jgi:hypothetical protein